MKLNSAASMFSKDISTLGIGEVVQASIVIMAIVLAVVLAFGVKTYRHWKNHSAQEDEDALVPIGNDEPRKRKPPGKKAEFPKVAVAKPLGEMRGSAAIRHIID